ncbi:DNA primase [Patescibacteria group bacterium]|nr:DNA primase [Candidatus Falkowbacteria bacterium]MBU3905866.1 DNA primase [Patescibacteria group bacterium]MBU4015471.1 DNA primase [Patescibacteria group bacterium]MBU4026413.1 DNA primase [Patescibacteria group bacterium]MBU4072686.1 DNA primase [Patescibacteria group bacterium]
MLQPSDEIKSKLDIVDLIREYIQLKPAGINFRAPCPFHNEKTPSFMVSPEKQIWHCFGCGAGGDIFSFVMEMEGISFVEALRLLAPKAGVKLTRQDPKLTSQRNRLLDIIELSAKYYNKILLESKQAPHQSAVAGQAEAARKYLTERGLTEETIEEWQIGYSPESWDDLINFLKSKDYNENEIFLAGMSVKKEAIRRAATNGAHANDNNVCRFYNRFRGRIMFPIKDVNGNIVAFSARVSPEKEAEEKMGKYINSPQTMVYDKSKILFGLDMAKQAIKKEDAAIIVEGQMDVITAHQNGFKNVIASSGTALTADQVLLIKRYSQNLILAFDMDKAGELAAERGIAQAMQQEMNIKVLELGAGKDPDEFIRKNPDGWSSAVAKAKPMMQYYFDKTLANLDLTNIDHKRQAAKILLPVIAKLGNKIEQDFWLKKLGQEVDVAPHFLHEALARIKPAVNYKEEKKQPEKQRAEAMRSRAEMLSELLLALMLKFPAHIEYAAGKLNPDQIDGCGIQAIYRNLIIYYNKSIDKGAQTGEVALSEINFNDFKNWLKQNSLSGQANDNTNESQPALLDKLALLADKDFYTYDSNQAKNEIIKIIAILKKGFLSKRLKEAAKLIAQAEKNNNKAELDGLMDEFKLLSDEIEALGNLEEDGG